MQDLVYLCFRLIPHSVTACVRPIDIQDFLDVSSSYYYMIIALLSLKFEYSYTDGGNSITVQVLVSWRHITLADDVVHVLSGLVSVILCSIRWSG